MNDSTTERRATLRELYERRVEEGGYRRDSAQLEALAALEALQRRLTEHVPSQRGLFGRLLNALRPAPRWPAVEGLYLWGGVGRGKTLLMDLFYESLPIEHKYRRHFHRFMQRVHAERRALGEVEDPLAALARRWAGEFRVLCFDEFAVSDIADAMILGRLLRGLFAEGVTLVATSNSPPAALYRDGLQRRRFLPAIEALAKHTRVFELDGGTDYRLEVLTAAEIYHSPLDAAAETSLLESFTRIAPGAIELEPDVEVNGRPIPARRAAKGVVWFDFEPLCAGPRSQDDYIELARCYHSVLISGVPALTREREDPARRFIALVDEFYDRRVKLILSAEVPLEALYQGRRLEFEFERTRSRLAEMQSREYLAAEHRP